jgi:2-desacetyl-2-hydroxyethyl bacteriochlorophyllide A dehydrogenase
LKAKQLWFTKPYCIEIRHQQLDSLKTGEILVRSICSGISSGTELLAYRGQLPRDLALDASLDALKDSSADYPLQYGYATVGCIEDVADGVDKDLIGKNVFAFQPHASHFISKEHKLILLPDDISPEAAVFLANTETAVNLILDGRPRIGENVIVLGLGIVGLLLSKLLVRFPVSTLVLMDNLNERLSRAGSLKDVILCNPDIPQDLESAKNKILDLSPGGGADLVYELTGAPDTLNLAIDLAGYAGRIVIGSWYGNKSSDLHLGGKFHRDRIELISSQVSTIHPVLTGRWNKARRLNTALDMIRDMEQTDLITHRVPIDSAAEIYQELDENPQQVLQAILIYQD